MGVSFALPASPTAEDIFLARIFEEPLVPMGAVPTLQENAEFATALVGYAKGDGPDDFSALTAFLDAHPDSPWNGALLTDLGLVYYRRGDGGVLAGETDATDLIGGYSYITTALVLSAATVGQPYSQAFTSVMGTPPVSYTLSAARAAPPGLTLTSAGVLPGTPTASGTFPFTVVATDAAALSDEQTFTLQANT